MRSEQIATSAHNFIKMRMSRTDQRTIFRRVRTNYGMMMKIDIK